ncbi:TetR/AcrR family transcriptional regulator [Prauserella halophila]|uniref:TetR/AcrR family transcriptional regulator n=1 Tax=Prauserella halophila TaxID=185641 RepID=A0ABP4GG97_9PSEU|nr:TetR/AcrR family transcriptional regulator [Prauserella halophila]MCP2234404.1 transcriptional regulator, TetR family [Prauserella halophila]
MQPDSGTEQELPAGATADGSDTESETFVEAARRDQIVRAAVAVIADVGYGKASFVRIAGYAGISPGLITYHFRTKERLIRRVLRDIAARQDQAMEGDEPVQGYEDGLRRIVTGHVEHCAARPEEMAARREIMAATLTPALRADIDEHERAGRTELVDFLLAGQQHGEFRPFDPDTFADAMYGALREVPGVLRRRVGTSARDYGRELADLLCTAATGRPPGVTG